jgi:hypothetical protein
LEVSAAYIFKVMVVWSLKELVLTSQNTRRHMPEYPSQARWKIRVTGPAEILVSVCRTTRHYMPNLPRCDKLKAHTDI